MSLSLRILVGVGGLILSAGCAFALYFLIHLMLSGAFSGSWIQVVAGGFLLYLFGVMLAGGFIIGLYLIILVGRG